MNKIFFADVKDEILISLKKSFEKTGIIEKVSLVDGFVTEPLTKELTDALVIGGPQIPMIMLVGEETGRIYFFALKALLPGKI